MTEKEMVKMMIQEARRDNLIRDFKSDLLKIGIMIGAVSLVVGMALMYLWLSLNGAITPVQ